MLVQTVEGECHPKYKNIYIPCQVIDFLGILTLSHFFILKRFISYYLDTFSTPRLILTGLQGGGGGGGERGERREGGEAKKEKRKRSTLCRYAHSQEAHTIYSKCTHLPLPLSRADQLDTAKHKMERD